MREGCAGRSRRGPHSVPLAGPHWLRERKKMKKREEDWKERMEKGKEGVSGLGKQRESNPHPLPQVGNGLPREG